MQPIASISQIASLMADPKRSAMLWALIDGTARPSEELALMTGLTPSSACAHLARLSAGGLLKREARGRKRYFRLAAPEIGTAVEALASVTIAENRRPQNRKEDVPVSVPLAMRRARLCWDHLGGRSRRNCSSDYWMRNGCSSMSSNWKSLRTGVTSSPITASSSTRWPCAMVACAAPATVAVKSMTAGRIWEGPWAAVC